MVVIGLSKNLLLKSVLGHCDLLYHYTFYFKDVNQFEVGPHERLLNTQYDLNKYKETTDEVIRGTSIRVDKTGSFGPWIGNHSVL